MGGWVNVSSSHRGQGFRTPGSNPPTHPLAEQRFKPMINLSFPWGEGRRNALLDGGPGPAKWPRQYIWLPNPLPSAHPDSSFNEQCQIWLSCPQIEQGKHRLPLQGPLFLQQGTELRPLTPPPHKPFQPKR
ncbi:hypothetical protein C8255_24880 [filamentous cyanobacterium CCP3]|nr:hypothetical protein C8255_24880 [filamentous cyanobacterium CCP3]